MADEKQTCSINGAFSFKGEDKEKIYEIAVSFFDWCETQEKTKEVVLISNRADYNGYWPIDRTGTMKEEKK